MNCYCVIKRYNNVMKIFSSKKIVIICFFVMFIINLFGQDISWNYQEKSKEKNHGDGDRPSVALVLAGGGARGYALIPFLEIIEELGIPVDLVAGTSAGAIVGGFYAAGHSPAEIKEALINVNWPVVFADTPTSPYESILNERSTNANLFGIEIGKNLSVKLGAGISAGQRAYQIFKEHTIKIPSEIEFDDLPIRFRAVATELLTGNSKFFSHGDLAEVIRASMSVPGMFSPAIIDGVEYIDGGVTNNLPINEVKALGYDIIIAIEISEKLISDPKLFDSAPVIAFFQMYLMTQAKRNEPYYKEADLVVIPDLQGATMFDFQKGQEIYEIGEISKEAVRESFIEIRNKIFPNQPYIDKNVQFIESESQLSDETAISQIENQSKVIIVNQSVENLPEQNSIYSELNYLSISKLNINGAVHADEKYIDILFNAIKNKPITSDIYRNFINSIYETGHYQAIQFEIIKDGQENELKILLYPVEDKKGVVFLSGSYVGSFSLFEQTKLTLSTDFQVRGLTGDGSVLSVKTGFVNSFYADMMYMQPIGPKSYFLAGLNTYSDRDFITSSFQSTVVEGYRIFGTNLHIELSRRFNSMFQGFIGAEVEYINTAGYLTPNIKKAFEKRTSKKSGFVAVLPIHTVFSTLNSPVFPETGVYFGVENKFVVPLNWANSNNVWGTDLIKITFVGAIPLAKRITLLSTTFAGSDLFDTLFSMPGIVAKFGFNYGERFYFPQFAGVFDFGSHQVASQLSLQFRPWENLTIFGGQLFINIFGTVGNMWLSYDEVINSPLDNLQWNSGTGIGLRVKENFVVLLRAGAGSYGPFIRPFMSFDVGLIYF